MHATRTNESSKRVEISKSRALVAGVFYSKLDDSKIIYVSLSLPNPHKPQIVFINHKLYLKILFGLLDSPPKSTS